MENLYDVLLKDSRLVLERKSQILCSLSNKRGRDGDEEEKEKQFWLLKTEPGEWSWEDQFANGGISKWDGVKNKQAQKYMKSMKVGDFCFFYHSGNKSRKLVGIVSVIKEWYFTDKGEDKEGAVDVKEVGGMNKPIDLKEMKLEEGLKGFLLFKQPRLSVVPVPKNVWDKICEIGGGFTEEEKEEEATNVWIN
ncbi:thymocyte nuclear protein 1-like [Papaver somniferum]|uniref:thymocyte nuclear protein 1-like n=1 Tax=Papaver somniferum TaxID=3469 RepID=UPI000E6F5957|nr:thymocyte nuclear protein 1-like [Papaver somniferum]